MERKISISGHITSRIPKARNRQQMTSPRSATLDTHQVKVTRIVFDEQVTQRREPPHETTALAESKVLRVPDILSLPVFPDEITQEDTKPFGKFTAEPTQTVGALLRVRRERQGMSITDVAHAIHTTSDYIRAIEEGDWHVFSARVYAEGFFKKILAVLTMQDRGTLIALFAKDWQRAQGEHPSPFIERPRQKKVLVITSRHLVFAGVGVLVAGVIGFLALRLVRFTGAPKLVIREPAEQMVLQSPIVHIAGSVDGESRVTVNYREVKIDEHGNFDEELALRPGVNTLEFRVINRLKKETTAVRHVIVE